MIASQDTVPKAKSRRLRYVYLVLPYCSDTGQLIRSVRPASGCSLPTDRHRVAAGGGYYCRADVLSPIHLTLSGCNLAKTNGLRSTRGSLSFVAVGASTPVPKLQGPPSAESCGCLAGPCMSLPWGDRLLLFPEARWTVYRADSPGQLEAALHFWCSNRLAFKMWHESHSAALITRFSSGLSLCYQGKRCLAVSPRQRRLIREHVPWTHPWCRMHSFWSFVMDVRAGWDVSGRAISLQALFHATQKLLMRVRGKGRAVYVAAKLQISILE